jgi:hypothetical protein
MIEEKYTIEQIKLALDMCKKYNIDVKTSLTIDSEIETIEIETIESKYFLYNLDRIHKLHKLNNMNSSITQFNIK